MVPFGSADLQRTSYNLQVTSCKLQLTTYYKLLTTYYLLLTAVVGVVVVVVVAICCRWSRAAAAMGLGGFLSATGGYGHMGIPEDYGGGWY